MVRPHRVRLATRDNGGIRLCYSVNLEALAGPFGRALVSVTRAAPGGRFKRGDLTRVVTTVARAPARRAGGVHSWAAYNGVIPLKKDGSPLATRVYGAVYLEARPAGYTRLAALARALL